jgi:hypothetical protein
MFPVANDHHPHNPINDQLADDIQATIDPHETIPGNAGGNREPSIRFPIANNHPQPMISRRMISNPPSIRMKRYPESQWAPIPVVGPRLDHMPRAPCWMDIPNWSLTGLEPVGHVIW